jgi:hypothetical protein
VATASHGATKAQESEVLSSLACIQHWLFQAENLNVMGAPFHGTGFQPNSRHKKLLCHFNPLDDAGETVNSLEGNQDRLEGAVKNSLCSTIARLKKEATANGGPSDIPY